MDEPHAALIGRTVAVPETRLLDVLASMLEKRGATVLRCPLVSIKDAADERPVVAWIERLIATPPDLLILYTGEGINRLLGHAKRAGLEEAFKTALANARTLTRGPKPKQALRNLGLAPAIEAPAPTTDGIIAALESIELDGTTVGVQIYGTEPNAQLLDYLARRHAEIDCVAPYAYASEADDEQVVDLIGRLRRGEIDAIAFTSKAQVDRLRKLAGDRDLAEDLAQGLRSTRVAAVGPVVAAELQAAGIRVDAMPGNSYHLKPLVNELVSLFAKN
jgi:uroporphyrinogen-III synthase